MGFEAAFPFVLEILPRKGVFRLLFLPNDKNFRNTIKAAVLPPKKAIQAALSQHEPNVFSFVAPVQVYYMR
jgi:hypothetical protein